MTNLFRLDDKNGNTFLLQKKKIQAVVVLDDEVVIHTDAGLMFSIRGHSQLHLDNELNFLDKALD